MDKDEIDSSRWFVPAHVGDDGQRTVLLEQYKLYVATTGDISDRRGSAHTLLLTVNTSLVTVYGLMLGKDMPVTSVHGPWRWMVPLVGLLVALTWFHLIRSYRAVNTAKFRVIAEIEKRLAVRAFDLEWEYLRRGNGAIYSPLTHVEQYIPISFGAFYLALLFWSLLSR
jgi:hypothetical protein